MKDPLWRVMDLSIAGGTMIQIIIQIRSRQRGL